MKYEFIKVDEDTTKLKYKDKEFEIRRNVELMKDFQELNAKARRKMIMDLAKEGMSTKDLTIKNEKDGKIFYDNSNVKELEDTYMSMATFEMFDNLCKKYFELDFTSLAEDIGLDEKGIESFGADFIKALTGTRTTPRKEGKQ